MQCTHCKKEKPKDNFPVNTVVRGSKTYAVTRHICQSCLTETSMRRQRDRFNGDEEARLNHRWKITINSKYKRYGITLEQALDMLEQQSGQCGICGQSVKISRDTPRENQACVDHCHTSGKVRGLLCPKCNSGLGMFDDDIDRLKAAMAYLS